MQSCCISAVMVNKHPQLRSLGLLLLFALSTGLISEYPALTYYHKGHKGSTPNRIQSSQQQQTQQQLCHDISFRRRYRQLFSSYDAQAKITSQAHQPSEDGDEVSHPQEEEGDDDDIEYTQGDEDDTDSIDGEDDFMSVDSPLSQLPPEEFATRYPRDEWLDAATEKMFDTESFPLGSLSEEDVETTAGLMVAWVRRRSVEAALTVERLLKRIVDDMRAGNKSIHVTTRIYTIAIDAWAKSGAEGSAQRAQHIHEAMVEMYKATGDPAIQPSAISYNALINAHSKSNNPGNLEHAEKVLQEMIESSEEPSKPDAITFSTLMDAYARSKHPNATKRAEELFELMDEIKVKRNVFTFSSLQNVYARSGLPDAPQKVEEILKQMQALYDNGDVFAKPTAVNYNALLNALSRSSNQASAEKAVEILQKMEIPVSKGGYDVEPITLSYALAILTCARCEDDQFGVYKAEELLERMEARAEEDERRRLEISSAAPPNVRLDLESYNVVLTALSKSSAPNAIDRIVSIIKRMEEHIEEGQEHIRPNTRSWNALLNALSRERSEESSDRAEQLLSHMYKLHSEGINVKPDAFSYVAVLGCLQKSSNPLAVERADEILRSMEELHDNGDLDDPPDVYHYTIVCAAWAKSRQQRAPGRVMQILAHMTELDAAGVPHVRPNVRTYNAVLDCLARGGSEDEAERLLDHMLFLSQQGEECLDSFSFNCCINAFCRKNDDDGGRRAEMVLERFLEYNEDHPRCKPDSRSFTRIIDFYRRSRQPDAPYRAEYILNRMIALFVAGNSGVKPNPFSFKAVMDAYSSARHPDAGVTAERLLRQMKELDKKYDQLNLALDSSVVHRVLFAWSTCGDEDAGRRAEIHLDDMERKYLAGDETMKPTTRSYGLVLNAWSKSSSFDKAKRSLDILKRMEKQRRLGNTDVYLSEHVHSLVINACAFTNSGMEAETEAFRIAVTIFDKMIASKDCQPSSLAYGWFIQACGRLQMPQDMKDRHIERAWNLCCQNGLVNGFVLHRFTGAAPEVLYKKLMASVLSRISSHPDDTKEKLKFRISPKDLPLAWTKKANNFHKQDGNSGWWGK